MLEALWECRCAATRPGDLLALVGSHERLGHWSPHKAVVLTTDAASFPTWRTGPLAFAGPPRGPLSLEYKFLILRAGGGVEWEALSSNRSASLPADSVSHIQNVWGSLAGRRGDTAGSADEAGGGGLRPALKRSAFILANTGPISDYYLMDKTIGRGTWGEVKLVVDKQTKARRAAKKIPKCYIEDAERFRQEIEIMKALDHPNIVRLFETFEDASAFYLVMEFCGGGELFDRLLAAGALTERLACAVMRQVRLLLLRCCCCCAPAALLLPSCCAPAA
ncbi:hypothetical protein ETH_00038830, partial [Eimeria tenella]